MSCQAREDGESVVVEAIESKGLAYSSALPWPPTYPRPRCFGGHVVKVASRPPFNLVLPHYKSVTGFFNKNKIRRIMMDSDGNTRPILDLVIEAGITGHWPLEVNSGIDVRTLRKPYGNKLFLSGDFDKRKIAKGGEPMRKEMDSKLPLMKETGEYVAGLDHLVHVEFTLERFKEYTSYLKEKLVMQ